MKKLLSLILSLCLLCSLFLVSCGTDEQKKDQEDEKQEEKDPKTEIFDTVIAMLSEERYDVEGFLDDYFGEFYVPALSNGQNKFIFKKGDVVASAQNNGETLYLKVKDGKLSTVCRTDDGAKLHLESTVDYPYSYPLSIFTSFGIDMSGVYSIEENTVEEPELDYADLELSEDGKTVVFGEEYMSKLAIYLFQSMDDAEKDLKDLEATGVYTVADEKIVFEISANSETHGKLKAYCSYTEENGVPSSSVAEISMDKDGTVASMKATLKDMKFENGKLSSFVEEFVKTAVASGVSNGTAYTQTSTQTSTYSFEKKDGKAANFDIEIITNAVLEYSGGKQTSDSTVSFSVIDGNLNYTATANGQNAGSVSSSGVTFGDTSSLTIPEEVYNTFPK